MPRGRHRHSPPLHRLLPFSAIAGVSLVCALGPWLFTQPSALRALAAAAAVTAVGGAVVMRHWDSQAGRQVADLTRARASDEWRHEERVAELETDLEESRELRVKLEQRLRAKRAELAGLRNEHAALLRRYATAETERASALEGRRLLEIETVGPARALPAGPVTNADAETGPDEDTGAVAAGSPAEAEADGEAGTETAVDAETEDGTGTDTDADAEVDDEDAEAAAADEDAEEAAPAIFSPEGSRLFLRAKAALGQFDAEATGERSADIDGEGAGEEAVDDGEASVEAQAEADSETDLPEDTDADADADADTDAEPSEALETGAAPAAGADREATPFVPEPRLAAKPAPRAAFLKQETRRTPEPEAPATAAPGDTGGNDTEAGQEDEARGKPEAVDGHQRAAATPPARSTAQPVQQPSGHFIAPTAVAVVPGTPARRPMVEGGFDFFGTQQETGDPLESVQNEDLADVVGQEALALHKAESETQFKPATEQARGVGQVIDLTAHDETEHIDVEGLRSAVS
ncbi:hypothetical protein ABZT03_30615 [Streptomyces sp. NPDC005574]|uniref:hypothetical protein n=1 Tax=Streptomyces sp. NPDC005574 TaxID=3156891 RepID=UPI0033B3C12B